MTDQTPTGDMSRAAIVAEQSIRRVEEAAGKRAREFIIDTIGKCESPIEQLFLIAMATHAVSDMVRVMPQVQMKSGHIADFVVSKRSWSSRVIADVIVECDGHEFHEKTKEQVERDKKRDRTLLAEGFNVLRFSGREVWRDPFECADEVIRYLDSRLLESSDVVRAAKPV